MPAADDRDRPRRMTRSPTGLESDWALVSSRTPTAANVRARIMAALNAGKAPQPYRSDKRRDGRVVFRYRPTKERVVLERDGRLWSLEWKGSKTNLDRWSTIETDDKVGWIVRPPQGDHFPHPVRPAPPLGRTLFSTWFALLQDSASPMVELPERRRIIAAARVIRALQEAVDRDNSSLIDRLDTLAGRYLRKRGQDAWKNIDGEKRLLARERHVAEELTLVATRPVALESLVDTWFHQLTDATADDAVLAVEKCLRSLQESPYYQKLVLELAGIEAAGTTEIEKIAKLYEDTKDALKGKRRELLCAKCAAGGPAPGRDPERLYMDPVPGDVKGWGCSGGPCGREAEERVREFAVESARRFVGGMLVTLGLPRNKLRSLFDYERAGWERRVGKRKKKR